jgi:hypothetical protein
MGELLCLEPERYVFRVFQNLSCFMCRRINPSRLEAQYIDLPIKQIMTKHRIASLSVLLAKRTPSSSVRHQCSNHTKRGPRGRSILGNGLRYLHM